MATNATRLIPAVPAVVTAAFTRSILLRQWLCDVATVAPRPGGRLYFWWRDDTWVAGSFGSVEPEASIVMRWEAAHGRPTGQVAVTLEAAGAATRLRVEHEPAAGEDATAVERFWDEALTNLVYVLETGLDRRVYERPMLGIFLNVFDAATAARLGVPVTEGSRIDGVQAGSGAERAGLAHDDVIVEIGGHPVTGFRSVGDALTGRLPADVVSVAFYRDGTLRTVPLELSRRPRPAIPPTAPVLAKNLRHAYDESLAALAALFDGVAEDEAAWRETPDAWSSLEVLAHLIHAERTWIGDLADVVAHRDRAGDEDGDNLDAQVAATARAFGSADALLGELRHLADEAVALVAMLPDDFVAARCPYVSAVTPLVETHEHVAGHAEQIRATLEAARAARMVPVGG